MKSLKKAVYAIFMIAGLIGFTQSVSAESTNGDLRIFSIANSDKKELPARIVKQLEKDGFSISADTDMTKPFSIQFKKSDFDVFHLMTIYHDELSAKLVKKVPNAGVFTPMGVGVYQRIGDKELHVSILTSKAQSKILGLKKIDPILVDIETKLIASLKAAMPGAKIEIESDNPLPAEGKLLSIHEMEVEADEWEDVKEELTMTLEAEFKPVGFVVAAQTDYNSVLTKEGSVESPFDFYNTYSICKLKVIYTVAKTRPQAAAFAPCTLMLYKEKGKDKLVMGFPSVYNWMSSARVVDENAKKALMKAQTDFENILIEATE
jgi:uncharacterized protein (DUF302 family)